MSGHVAEVHAFYCVRKIVHQVPTTPESLQRFLGVVERKICQTGIKCLFSLVSAKNRPGNFQCTDMLYKPLLSDSVLLI